MISGEDIKEENRVQQMKLAMGSFIRNANSITTSKRKSGGGAQIQKWREGFDPLSINPMEPLFRTLEGTNHTIFAIDTDVVILSEYVEELKTREDIRKLKLNAVMTFWERWNKKYPKYNFFDYVSGKGMYRTQIVPNKISKTVFTDILWNETNNNKGLLKGVDGFKQRKEGIVNNIILDNIEYKIIIDTTLYIRGPKVFRVPYSAYLKFGHRTFYCVPVVKDSKGEYDKEETIKRTQLSNIVVGEQIYVPLFQFSQQIISEMGIGEIVTYQRIKSRRIKKTIINLKFNIPEPDMKLDAKQKNLLLEMEKEISCPDSKFTPPCIYNAFMKKNDHWMRVVILRYLASMNYKYYPHKKHYSHNDLALFFRFVVNNKEDNSLQNKNKVFGNISTFIRNPELPDKPPSCSIMQTPYHQYHCCSSEDFKRCKRNYCMYNEPVKKIIQVHKDTDTEKDSLEFEEIRVLAQEMIVSKAHLEAIKTTRAGITTTLILTAASNDKTMLVLVPTNAIARDVFTKALKLIYNKYDMKINGAVLTSNIKSCLKLRFVLEDLKKKKQENPDWGKSNEIEWRNLPFHSKPSCTVKDKDKRLKCPYYKAVFDYPHRRKDGTPYPIINADVTKYRRQQLKEGFCAYQTVLQKVSEYDVIFMTYDKLASLLLNIEAEAKDFLFLLTQHFDIIFLDEISNLIQSSPLAITMCEEIKQISRTKTEKTISTEDYIENLHKDLSKLDTPKNLFNPHRTFEPHSIKTLDDLRHLTTNFMITFDKYIREKRFNGEFNTVNSWKVDNPLLENGAFGLEEFRENFFAYYSLLSNYTKQTNDRLNSLIDMILLLQNEIWWLQSLPKVDGNEKVSLVQFLTAPKLKAIVKFVKELDEMGKQIIVVDATMPLASPKDVFDIEFEKFIIGDPRKTCDKQIVIPDYANKSIMDIFKSPKKKNEKYNETIKDMIAFINNVVHTHGKENVLVILPNSSSMRKLLYILIEDKLIPQLKSTWFRSAQTIGVECKERVMITLCAPTPPRFSHLWLAEFYRKFGLFDNYISSRTDLSPKQSLAIDLEKMNEHQTFYQTIGRAKDPQAREYSVVYCWGMNYKKIKQIIQMDIDVPIPHIVDISPIKNDNKLNTFSTMIGKAWKKFGVILDYRFIKIYTYLEEWGYASFKSLKRVIREKDFSYLIELSTFINVLNFFGIECVMDNVTEEKYFITLPNDMKRFK